MELNSPAIRRDDHLRHSQRAGHAHGVDRSASSKCEKNEPPGVPATFGGDAAQGAYHVGIDDGVDTERGVSR